MNFDPNTASLESLKSHCQSLVQQFEATVRQQTALINEIKEIVSKIESAEPQASLSAEVITKFCAETWAPKVEQACAESQIWDEGRRDSISEKVGHRLESISALAKVMDTDEDTQDLKDHLVFAYVALKSEWYQLNTIINYGYMTGRPPETETEVLAVLVSWMIVALDSVFSAAEIEVLADYLFAPLGNARELNRAQNNRLAA